MYVTRPLSQYRASPEAASAPPPEGRHSGYLVAQDEEFEAQATCCWGLCRDPYLGHLPFPQNRLLTVEYTVATGQGTTYTIGDDVVFFPVPGQPLSSNRYYVVRTNGKDAGKGSFPVLVRPCNCDIGQLVFIKNLHRPPRKTLNFFIKARFLENPGRGRKVCTCSKEEDKRNCCFCSCVKDVKPKPFDYGDVYQQVEIVPNRGCGRGFYARAVAPDGYPPEFLRRKGWRLRTSHSRSLNLDLGVASGVDAARRARLPDTNFPISGPHSPAIVVGKWYCPFIFVKEEGCPPKEQMKKSVFYEVTLEQFWEAIHTCENTPGEVGRAIQVNAGVRRESALLRGCEPVGEELPVDEGVVWFRPAKVAGGGVGLSAAVVEKVVRAEEYGGGGWGWRKFGCYMLVERFALRRVVDGAQVLAYDFRHVDKIITRWE